jgi:hypothetical protein
VWIRRAAAVWRLSPILLHYDLGNNVYKLSANKHRRSFASERETKIQTVETTKHKDKHSTYP